jgi:putative transposase
MKDDGYKIRDEFGVYYLTFAVVQWVDVFSKRTYVDIVLNSLKYCIENKQLKLFAWCIMTNHLHLIAQSSKRRSFRNIKRFQKVYIFNNYRSNRTK